MRVTQPLAILELATNFWLLMLSILHNYAWDLKAEFSDARKHSANPAIDITIA